MSIGIVCVDVGLFVIVVQHGMLVVGCFLVNGWLDTVVQGLDGGTTVVLDHREQILELNSVLGQFVVHVTAHVYRHCHVPGQHDAGQITWTRRFFRTVQQHCPRVLAVHHIRVVNPFVCKKANQTKIKC